MDKIQVSTHGKTFYAGSKHEHFWRRVANGLWEPHTYKVFERFLSAEHSYIDIGAWIGPTVLYGAQIAKHTYAVEPDPVALQFLKTNLMFNQDLIDKITLFEGCIGESDGQVQIGTNSHFGDSMSSLLFAGSGSSATVPSLTFDSFITISGAHDFNFIKMDIEGAEGFVLSSMKRRLLDTKPTLHLSLHSGWFNNLIEDSNKIVDVLSIYKYLYNHHGCLLTRESLTKNILHKGKIYDVIATDIKW